MKTNYWTLLLFIFRSCNWGTNSYDWGRQEIWWYSIPSCIILHKVFLFCNPGETSHVKAFSTLLSILIFLKHSETIWNIGKINTNANEKLECWFKGELHCNLGTVSWNFKWTKLFVHLTVQLKMWRKKSYLALSLNYVTILDIHDT